jgi:uncharacterized protein (UPF0548 family)
MFFVHRPSQQAVDHFLDDSRELQLSYGPVGIVKGEAAGYALDEMLVAIGKGTADFERAREALLTWSHFDLGWAELFPRRAPVAVGTIVAVLIRHFGFWSLNGCRVVYTVGSPTDGVRFGFAYGTLTNHAEAGEELFEVFLDPGTDEVMYRIRATSRPRATLARLGQPIVRALQASFRRDSAAAMKKAVLREGEA